MKKIVGSTVILFLMAGMTMSQNVPNGGFENWEDTGNGVMEPVDWQTNNLSDLTFVYQETGHSGQSSARISVEYDGTLGMNITPMLFSHGFFPVSERFTALNCYLMGESLNDDYLVIAITMYKDGMSIGVTYYTTYEDYADWTEVSVPISYATEDVPDHCSVNFTFWPSDAVDLGTYFFIDDLELGSGGGPVAPVMIGAVTNSSGTAFELNFSVPMADPSGAQSQFSGTHDGTALSFSSAALKSGFNSIIVLTLAAPVQAGEVLKVSYTAGTVTSAAGVPLATFTNENVTNLVGGSTGTWHVVPGGTTETLYQVHFANASTGYIGGGWGTCLKSSNGGLNWTPVDIPAQYDLLTLYATSPDVVHVGSWDSVYNTSNGGATWSGVYLNTVNYWVMDLQFRTANLGYMFLQASGFKKTTDGGSSWTELTGSGVIDDFHDGYMIDDNNGFAVGITGIIARSNDGGQTWPQYEYNNWTEWSPITIEGVHFTSLTNGFAVADSGVLFRTTDGGEHWTRSFIAGPDDHLMDIFFLNANQGWIVGYHGKIFTTSDGGASWNAVTPVTTNDLNSVFFINPNLGWAVGTNGTILRFGDASSAVPDQENEPVTDMVLFPNPSSGQTSLHFNLREKAVVCIDLYNAAGQLIRNEYFGPSDQGAFNLQLDTEGLSRGLCFLRITAGGQVKVESLVIQ